jgi:hypothetical protein
MVSPHKSSPGSSLAICPYPASRGSSNFCLAINGWPFSMQWPKRRHDLNSARTTHVSESIPGCTTGSATRYYAVMPEMSNLRTSSNLEVHHKEVSQPLSRSRPTGSEDGSPERVNSLQIATVILDWLRHKEWNRPGQLPHAGSS